MESKDIAQWKVALAFFAIYVIWGTTYIAITFGLESFPPFLFCAFRYFTAGILLFLIAKAQRNQIPPAKIIVTASIGGTIALVGGSGLVTWAEQYIGSGHAATVIATEPFMFILFDRKLWRFYFSQKTIIAGLLLGFVGLVLFSYAAVPKAGTENMQLIGNLVLILSAALWVAGSLFSKRADTAGYSNVMLAGIQLMAAGIASAIFSGLAGEYSRFSLVNVTFEAWSSLVYMITMGSMVAFLAFTWLMTIRPPALVSTHTYVNPVVAVLVGWMIAGETFNAMQIVGLVIILLAVLLTKFQEYKAMPVFAKYFFPGRQKM